MKNIAMLLAAAVLVSAPAAAQWDDARTPRVARSADGSVKMNAPAPRVKGKPDLSGIWQPQRDPKGKPGGVENEILPRYMVNIAADISGPPDTVVHPSFKALFGERLTNDSADPTSRCGPTGAIRLMHMPIPFKIVQTPEITILLHEVDTTYRQIFTDGRRLPKDPQLMFNGYSVGRWDGDVFVVSSMGYIEQAWLDAMGHPHTDALRAEERFRRLDTGHLDITTTLTDPKALTQPVTFTQHYTLLPDTDLFEYFCTQNEKDVPHYVQTN
jgi:hypothetical protein